MKDVFQRIFRLLHKEEQDKLFKMSLAVLVNALLNFASLAALLPVLYYLLEGGDNQRASLIFCAIAIALSLIKYLISTKLSLYQQRFLLGLYQRLSFTLYKSYFRRGLLFIRKNGFSKLGYEVNSLCYAFSEGVLAPMAVIAGDVMLVSLLVIALTVYSPLTALVMVLAFIPFVAVYLFVIRNKNEYYGKKMLKARRNLGRIVNDTFAGYADLEVNNSFDTYSKHFLEGIDEIRDSKIKLVPVQLLPSFLTELAIVAGLTVLATGVLGEVTILLGIFAVAAFRMLPAIRSILSCWTQIKNNKFCLEVIEEGVSGEEDIDNEDKELPFTEVLSFENVSYNYPDGETVLKELNFDIKKGEYVGMRGYSGVGKSTVFNLLLGFLKAGNGRILVDGVALCADNRNAWHKKIGYVPQDVFIFRGTLLDNITMGEANPDKSKVLAILAKLGLGEEWIATLSDGLDTDLCELGSRLSGGQKQRIGIARALYKNIELLLLDEATSALDNVTEREINHTFKELREDDKSLTIISIAHRESSMTYCDRVIELD